MADGGNMATVGQHPTCRQYLGKSGSRGNGSDTPTAQAILWDPAATTHPLQGLVALGTLCTLGIVRDWP